MSRSEHATRRDPRDPGDLDRKRRIKRMIAEQRIAAPDPPEVEASAVVIAVRDRGPYVHYPASPDDLRSIIARIPGCANGLGMIELCLDERPTGDGDLDPFIGRLSYQRIPGVYGSRTLGWYRPRASKIAVHGYVYDPALPERAVVEPYLRLHMLATFMHELAHHQDRQRRTGRGRWRMDDPTDAEIYAEALEFAWTRDHVVPYLEDTYADEYAALRAWLARHGGLALPLELLAGDPRTTEGTDGERLFFSIPGAFESLIERVAAGEVPPETCVAFANELHYGTNYDEALAVLDRVLAEHPDHAGALVLRADIFVHQDRLDDAERIVEACDARDTEALKVLADIAQCRGQWQRLRDIGQRLAELVDGWRWFVAIEFAIRGAIELADREVIAHGLAAMRGRASRPFEVRKADTLEALALLRDGRHADALAITARLAEGGIRSAEADAIHVEAAYHLHVAFDAGRVPRALAYLRRTGYGAWAARLEALAAG